MISYHRQFYIVEKVTFQNVIFTDKKTGVGKMYDIKEKKRNDGGTCMYRIAMEKRMKLSYHK